MLVDLRLGAESGIDLMERVLRDRPSLAVVIITAHGTHRSRRRGDAAGVRSISCPSRSPRPRSARCSSGWRGSGGCTAGSPTWRSRSAARSPRRCSRAPTRRSPRILEQARRVAATDAVVLIRGESGTGKGVLARRIHGWSRRSRGPLRHGELPQPQRRAAGERAVRPRPGRIHGRGPRHLRQGGRRRRGAPCSSTRSATCRSPCSPSCSGSSRNAGTSAWARRRPAPPTSPRSPRPTATWTPRPGRAGSARTCSTGSTSWSSPCRRSASGATCSLLAEHLLAFFSRQTGRRSRGSRRPPWRRSPHTPGRATSGSFAMPWNGPCSSRRDASSSPATCPGRVGADRSPGRRTRDGPGRRPVTLEQLETEHIRLVLRNSQTATRPPGSWASTRARSTGSGSSSGSERACIPPASKPLRCPGSRECNEAEPGGQATVALQFACPFLSSMRNARSKAARDEYWRIIRS